MALRGRICLVVGGGAVAARKTSLLLGAGAHVIAVAPELNESWRALCWDNLQHRARPFEPRDLDAVVFAIAAHEDRIVNSSVSAAAMARNIPVNVVDDPELCSVILPAIVDRSPVLIAIGTGGASPVLARLWRARIEALVPTRLRDLAELAAAVRGEVRMQLTDATVRRRFWEDVLDGEVAALVLAGQRERAAQALRELLAERVRVDENASGARRGVVTLVGAGPGDPELLSLRALRALQSADCVLADPKVGQPVLELGRRDAQRERLAVWPVPDLNGFARRLVTEVAGGRTVCVLAQGDAFREAAGLALRVCLEDLGALCVVVAGIV
jgi:uroporphyrin-III C-methyltransferase/precorrin-2 dehydrogenase/sirohydrochlorin ferrochelatase